MAHQDRIDTRRQSQDSPRRRRRVPLAIRLVLPALLAIALALGASYALRFLNL